ncbi:MFS transporter [Leucobacter sp. CSA2]|uniref:MFS transporter n=1 Tax=Leucobacter edaphi TaxID=2796472 RepID=A0A934QDK7_9MICO|nr:MFS transporter [Leucobacter edaphi]MBK0422654.1 MFS transporter [Leucobacter edaphi]
MNSASNQATGGLAPRTELPRSTVARFATGSLVTGGFSTLPGLVLIYYLTDSLGVTALVAGGIVTLAKIWTVLIDPLIGGLSDRALARTGSRRGLMLLGSLGLPIAFVLTFSVPAGTPPALAAVWVLLAFVVAATSFSLFQVPYISLPAELSNQAQERTRLLTWSVVVMAAAILCFGAGGPEIRSLFPQNPPLGYFAMAVGAALILTVGLAVASTVAPRKPVPRGVADSSTAGTPAAATLAHYRDGFAVLRTKGPFQALMTTYLLQCIATGLMLAGAQFVATWVLHDEDAVTILFVSLIAPAFLVAPVWRVISNRVGKDRALRAASVCFLAATILLIGMVWFPGWWIVVPVGLAGAAYAGMQSLPMAMLSDVIVHDARGLRRAAAAEGWSPDGVAAGAALIAGETPDSRAGIFGGVWTAGETAGLALGSTLLAVALAATGYVESVAGHSAQQPSAALTAISLSFSLVPAVLMAVSLVTLRSYRLRERDLDAENHPALV